MSSFTRLLVKIITIVGVAGAFNSAMEYNKDLELPSKNAKTAEQVQTASSDFCENFNKQSSDTVKLQQTGEDYEICVQQKQTHKAPTALKAKI